MEKVTFVIPHYKGEQYIGRALDSLAQQTVKDFRVIIVDDCSPEESFRALRETAARYSFPLEILRNETNQGPAASRKRGVLSAETEFISFLDGDDTYEPDFLKRALPYSETGADIAVTGFTAVYTNGKHFPHAYTDSEKTISAPAEALTLDVDTVNAMLFRRELLLPVEFPDFRNGEDMALMPVLFVKSRKTVVLPDCLYNYYYRAGTQSKKIGREVFTDLQSSFAYIEEKIGREYPKECEYCGIRNFLYGGILNLCKMPVDKEFTDRVLDEFEKKYPAWWQHEGIRTLPRAKKIFLHEVKARHYKVLRLLATAHKILTK